MKTAYENDPDYRKRIGRGVQEVFERDPTILTRISDSVKRLWQNPDYRARAVEGMEAIHVNNPELSCKQYEKSKHNRWRNRYADFRTGFCKDIYF